MRGCGFAPAFEGFGLGVVFEDCAEVIQSNLRRALQSLNEGAFKAAFVDRREDLDGDAPVDEVVAIAPQPHTPAEGEPAAAQAAELQSDGASLSRAQQDSNL